MWLLVLSSEEGDGSGTSRWPMSSERKHEKRLRTGDPRQERAGFDGADLCSVEPSSERSRAMLDYEYARHRMVETHIVRRGVRDGRVLSAARKVPREAFVDEGFEEFAYEDSPLPIGSGQTISQPFIVARMAEAAEI